MKKTAIITGAAGGIGYAAASLFSQNGYAVTAMDIVGEEQAAVKFNGFHKFRYVQGDLSKTEDREKLLKAAAEQFGSVGVLVNVAGVAPAVRKDILKMSEESYDRVMNINTKGTLFLTQLVANHMIENSDDTEFGGAIINISSMSAYTSSTSRGEYCISKAGVSMITKLFADRLSPYHITVNEIRPGIIETGMTSAVKEKYDKLIDEGLLPIKRWGQPEDVAKAVLVLASGQLGYTTGQSIDVDGGFHIRRL